MEAFRQVKDTFGNDLVNNFRPTQPLGRRKIYENTVILRELPDKNSKENPTSENSKSNETGQEASDYPEGGNEPKSNAIRIRTSLPMSLCFASVLLFTFAELN